MKSRYENRKTISLTRFEYVSLRCKDISELEGKSESAIIEEIIMGTRPALVPPSEQARELILRNYLDDDACTKIMKGFFDILTGRSISFTPDKERIMVECLHHHICSWSTQPLEADKLTLELIGIQIRTIKEHLEHCLTVAENEIGKISGHINTQESAFLYSQYSDHKYKLSKEIKFAEDLVDYFTVRQEYASYNTVSQLILGCWDFVKSVPATYSALSMIAKLNPVANIPANRYHLIENIFEASEDWDF